jgi:hypothetical protein
MEKRARRHHFVPEFHLKMFARGRMQLVDLFDKRWGKFARIPAASTAYVRDYYLLPGQSLDDRLALEREFRDLETFIAPIFRWLDAHPIGPIEIPEDARIAIAGYMTTLHARVPAYRDEALVRAREMAVDPDVLGLNDPDSFRRGLRGMGSTVSDDNIEAYRTAAIASLASGIGLFRVHPASSLGVLKTAVEKVGPMVVDRRWRFVRLLKEPGFVIGDQPVTLWTPSGHIAPSIGFDSPGVTIFMPISPSTLLLISHEPREPRLEIVLPVDTGLRYPGWAIPNHTAWMTAQRWIWGSSLRFLQATEAIIDPDVRRRDVRQLSPEDEAKRVEVAKERRRAWRESLERHGT